MAMNKSTEELFTQELLVQLKRAEKTTGIAEMRLAQQAQEHGGVAAVKMLLKRGQTTRQYAALQKSGNLRQSVEALVTKGKYAELFTDEEVNQCLTALLESGFYG